MILKPPVIPFIGSAEHSFSIPHLWRIRKRCFIKNAMHRDDFHAQHWSKRIFTIRFATCSLPNLPPAVPAKTAPYTEYRSEMPPRLRPAVPPRLRSGLKNAAAEKSPERTHSPDARSIKRSQDRFFRSSGRSCYSRCSTAAAPSSGTESVRPVCRSGRHPHHCR